jgi:hypothetical protein
VDWGSSGSGGGRGRGWEGLISLSFLVGKRRRWRWAASFTSSSSRCLSVFADRKTKRNGRQQEQEIDHEEIVEEEAGKREVRGELETEKKREKEE